MKILSYILSTIFAVVFFLILLIFHPLQWLGLKISQNTHQKVVNLMNWFLIKSLLILGVTVRFKNPYKIPENQTILFVANHQSMFDISPIIWYLRKHYPKFISKKELGKGIPSISFNLRHGGAALIDRKDSKQSITELINFSKRIKEKSWSSVIFPEGTRSKTGEPKKFATNGLKILAKYNPNSYMVPIGINNSWKVFRYGKFPLGIGFTITFEVLEPISLESTTIDNALLLVEERIVNKIKK